MLSQSLEAKVVEIPISKIKVIHRMRRTDDNNVDALVRSIKEIGMLHSICVAKKNNRVYPFRKQKKHLKL